MFSSLRKLHRLIGAVVAVFLIVLSVTGILLNHSHSLGLDKKSMSSPWILSHYQLGDLPDGVVYKTDKRIVSQYGEQLFVDTQAVMKTPHKLLGVVELENVLTLAFEDRLLLLTPEGEVIEWLRSESGVPQQIQNVGQYHGEPVLQTVEGMWRSDFMLDRWEEITLPGVRWSAIGAMPANMLAEIDQYTRGEGVNAEQVILDIHNGRILGALGPWLLDLIALMILGLVFSGLWIWIQRLAR